MLIYTSNGSYANLDQIYAIIPFKGQVSKRLRKLCKEQNIYYALNGGDITRSLLIFNNGMVMGSSATTKTLSRRCSAKIGCVDLDRVPGEDTPDDDDNDLYELEDEPETDNDYEEDEE